MTRRTRLTRYDRHFLGGLKITVDPERAPDLAEELSRIAPDGYVPDYRTQLGRVEFALALAQETIETLRYREQRARRNAAWWKLAAWALLLLSFGLSVVAWGHRG